MKCFTRGVCAAMTALALLIPAASPAQEMLGVTVRYTPAPTDAPAAAAEAMPTPAPTQAPAITQEDAAAAQLGERILFRGMEGEDVKIVQRRLYELGYYLGDVDGVFGLKTRSAVYAFQRAHKLEKVDGKVGPQTISAMRIATTRTMIDCHKGMKLRLLMRIRGSLPSLLMPLPPLRDGSSTDRPLPWWSCALRQCR